ncbi:hypothetical protein C1H46_036949 [Malus baccata]|uniref:Uncharacterized protein n=1 Tax=Malus baccata TaxID=106549 RepID=A0A540KTQ8_MALBA|nr:hypothetical protein C1H46_036949 [Malus baccata]
MLLWQASHILKEIHTCKGISTFHANKQINYPLKQPKMPEFSGTLTRHATLAYHNPGTEIERLT